MNSNNILSGQSRQPVSIFWFRRDLRSHDNRGFFEALQRAAPVLPVFIFDKNILSKLPDKSDKRVLYVHLSVERLHHHFLGSGSSLLVMHDDPLNAFQLLCEQFQVTAVFTNSDYEPAAIERDALISAWLSTKGIPFHSFRDQVIFEKSEVLKADGTPYTVFTPYAAKWKQKLREEGLRHYPCETLLSNLFKTKPFSMPALADTVFVKTNLTHCDLVPDREVIRNYHLTRDIPSIPGTSLMSVPLRFGTVSIRELVEMALSLNETWLNELIWREFFMMILFHHPAVVNHCFKAKYERIPWINDEKQFRCWCRGETGYPFVDAGMRELNETGWMHNRVRMVVAGFLTKHLLIDWRWGETYFAEKLLDYELSSNNGNWQWAAGCGCDAAPYFRIFNPIGQAKRFDPEMVYIKKWITDYKPGYLKPIVDHEAARKRAIHVYQKALTG